MAYGPSPSLEGERLWLDQFGSDDSVQLGNEFALVDCGDVTTRRCVVHIGIASSGAELFCVWQQESDSDRVEGASDQPFHESTFMGFSRSPSMIGKEHRLAKNLDRYKVPNSL